MATIQLIGRTRFGDRKDELHYVPGATSLGPDIEHEALAGGMSWPPGNPLTLGMAPARVTRGFVVAVGDPAPIRLTATPRTLTVAQGHQLNHDLALARHEGSPRRSPSPQTDLPPNVAAVDRDDCQGGDDRDSPPVRRPAVPPGTYTFMLRGTWPLPVQQRIRTRRQSRTSTSSNPRTRSRWSSAPPGQPHGEQQGGRPEQGGALEVDVTAARQNGFAGEVAA